MAGFHRFQCGFVNVNVTIAVCMEFRSGSYHLRTGVGTLQRVVVEGSILIGVLVTRWIFPLLLLRLTTYRSPILGEPFVIAGIPIKNRQATVNNGNDKAYNWC